MRRSVKKYMKLVLCRALSLYGKAGISYSVSTDHPGYYAGHGYLSAGTLLIPGSRIFVLPAKNSLGKASGIYG